MIKKFLFAKQQKKLNEQPKRDAGFEKAIAVKGEKM